MEKQIEQIINSQREYFKTGETLPVKFRIEMLKKLRLTIKKYELEIANALKADLGKGEYESYMCEIGLTLSEISYMIKHIKGYAKKRKVKTPLSQFPSTSYKQACPYGNVLVISPWNYPFLLSIDPVADAIAAGNTVVLKPSEYSVETTKIIKKIINECFSENFVAVVTGDASASIELLKHKFNMIFFTGNQNVGKEVLKSASQHLIPVVLELGGKSPCIVDSSAKIKLTAKRIVFGKFINCGQTCVAPDYILCDKKIKEQLINEIKFQIKMQYGEHPLNNADYGKIISPRHFERVAGLIDKTKVVVGGKIERNELQIEPTVLDNVSWNDKVMQEEIFGPILPVLTYENFSDVYNMLVDKPKPLALYVFSQDKQHIEYVTQKLQFGGGCVNDTIIHLQTEEMGFGGVGESGMGEYHGKAGFDTFSHTKSIVNKKTWLDLPMRYRPYKKGGFYEKLVRFFLK